jgi:hypothetical protein
MESPSNQEEIPEMVQHLYLDTLDRYVPQPAQSQTTEDLLLALKKFTHSVQWSEYWRLKRAFKTKSMGKTDDAVVVSESSQDSTKFMMD